MSVLRTLTQDKKFLVKIFQQSDIGSTEYSFLFGCGCRRTGIPACSFPGGQTGMSVLRVFYRERKFPFPAYPPNPKIPEINNENPKTIRSVRVIFLNAFSLILRERRIPKIVPITSAGNKTKEVFSEEPFINPP
jgi:hypothetical protein